MKQEQPASSARAAALTRLSADSLDVLVIGGGIIGAAVAALASEHGLTVGLVDRADFAAGTSSASSKLIHGGLRYLRMGDFRLVREALVESRALVHEIAPHLVRPLRFLLPIYEHGPYGPGAIRSALWLYRALAGSDARNGLLPGDVAQSLVPPLRLEHLRAVGVYSDAQAHDARLCLATLRAASDQGAALLNYAEVVALERGGKEWRAHVAEGVRGETLEVRAQTLVNATGPWIDKVRRLEDPSARASIRLSKGAHLLIEHPTRQWGAALVTPVDKSRVSFAVPWEGMLLLGTTDEAFEGEPDDISATLEDERQILSEAGHALSSDAVRPSLVRGRFAGLRVLPVARSRTARTRRETVITRGRSGMITVAGGKLTTHRRIAADVLEMLRSDLELPKVALRSAPLPGAADPIEQAATLRAQLPELAPETAELLACSYGSLAADVIAYAGRVSHALEPLVQGQPEIRAQVHYARDEEWAVTADDVLRRRTTLALRLPDPASLHARVEALLAEPAPR